MSDPAEMTESQSPGLATEAEAQPPMAFGARLRWERERAGLTVTDVAARLRLHPNQVRALEQESLAALPEAAYVRGFVRSYARILNLDPTPLVADLATKFGPATASVVDGMARQRDYSPVREAAREQASRRFVVLGAVLLLVALGALGWYATRGGSSPVSTVPASPQAAAPAAIPAALPPAATETAAPSSSAVPDMAPAAGDAPVIMEPVPVPPLLKIRFTGSSWAEVKDAEGKVLHSQHNNAGAEHVVEGTPPFYVVIGDAGKAVVEVRGEPYDMAPHTRQNVARFTID